MGSYKGETVGKEPWDRLSCKKKTKENLYYPPGKGREGKAKGMLTLRRHICHLWDCLAKTFTFAKLENGDCWTFLDCED